MQRYLEVLNESASKKPLGVVLRDGSVKGPGSVVAEDALQGGAAAYDRYMDEKPCRVKKSNFNQANKKGKKGGK